MRPPIAYTYEADTHCPDCAVARFGREITCRTCKEPANRNPISMAGTMHRYGPTTHDYDPHVWPWPPEDARDREGNPIGAIAPWDDTCEGGEDDRPEDGICILACGTCRGIITTHTHEVREYADVED